MTFVEKFLLGAAGITTAFVTLFLLFLSPLHALIFAPCAYACFRAINLGQRRTEFKSLCKGSYDSAATSIIAAKLASDDKLRDAVQRVFNGRAKGTEYALHGWLFASRDERVVKPLIDDILNDTLNRVDWRKVLDSMDSRPDWSGFSTQLKKAS
jgi:hypothetical protein